jgi:hypothetical protein
MKIPKGMNVEFAKRLLPIAIKKTATHSASLVPLVEAYEVGRDSYGWEVN